MADPQIPRPLRQRVRRRASNRCEYCHYPQVACYAVFECDHVVPTSAGGITSFANLAWACPTCNASKRNRSTTTDPVSGLVVSIFNPRTDHWQDHFRWSKDKLRI